MLLLSSLSLEKNVQNVQMYMYENKIQKSLSVRYQKSNQDYNSNALLPNSICHNSMLYIQFTSF